MNIESSSPFSPSDEQVHLLEESLDRFNHAPLAKLRNFLPAAFLAAWAGLFFLLSTIGLSFGWAWWLAGVVGMIGPAAIAGYFVFSGLGERTWLFDRVQAYLFHLRRSDWLTALAAGLIALPVLWLIGWLTPVMVGAALGLALGIAFYYAVDRPLAAIRRQPLSATEALLKSLRLQGVDEDALQQFVVQYSSADWEEFFETLFGYEAKLKAREEISKTEQGRRRPRFRAWRDGLIRAIDARLRADRGERDRTLQNVEEDELKAQGIDPLQARRQPTQVTEPAVEQTVAPRDEQPAATAGQPVDPKVIAAAKRSRQLQMLADVRSGAYSSKRKRLGELLLEQVTEGLSLVLSGKVRFLAGALLIAAFVFWLHANGITPPSEVISTEDAEQQAHDLLTAIKNVAFSEAPIQLAIPVVGPLLSSLGAGIAGSILVVLGLFRGWKMSLFAWPAAATALLMPNTTGYGIAAGLAVVGLFFGRTYDE